MYFVFNSNESTDPGIGSSEPSSPTKALPPPNSPLFESHSAIPFTTVTVG